jgi:transcriptional regulator with XRE-family HTH domain
MKPGISSGAASNIVSFSVGQVRAARGLIGWSQEELARQAKIGRATVSDFESGKREPYSATLDAIRHAIESAGVEFIAENGGGAGVRLRQGKPDAGSLAAEDLNASNDE